MDNTIKCPSCSEEIEVTQALRKDLEQGIVRELEKKHKHELDDLKESLEKTIKEEAAEKARNEFERKLKLKEEETKAINKDYEELTKKILAKDEELRKAKNIENEIREEMKKKLQNEELKLKEQVKKEAAEEYQLKIAEKDKKLMDAIKANEELKRKLEQGSQQTQGEALELQLEKELKQNFPLDEISEVPKGIRGADLIQTVKDRALKSCGTIVWEIKNTKSFSEGWVDKLKADQRELKAEVAVLVSKVLPQNIETFGFYKGVWVSDVKSAVPLALVLKSQLVNVKHAKDSSKGKEQKAEIVYNYLTSNEFKQRIEVFVEYFTKKREELDKEKTYFMKKWEKEDKEVQKIMMNTAGIYGDLQGLIGGALPQIKQLELE